MTLTLIAGGRHTGRIINARLRRENRDLKADKRQLAINAYRHEEEIHTALLRGCQDAMRIAQLTTQRDEYAAAVTRMEEQHGEEIRAHKRHVAELARRLELRSRTEAVATKTQEIPVITPVVPLHRAPFATTDPGRVPPSRVREDDTAPVPAVQSEGVA